MCSLLGLANTSNDSVNVPRSCIDTHQKGLQQQIDDLLKLDNKEKVQVHRNKEPITVHRKKNPNAKIQSGEALLVKVINQVFRRWSGYELKKQANGPYRLTLLEKMPLMPSIISAVTPPSVHVDVAEAGFLSSDFDTDDEGIPCHSAEEHDVSEEGLNEELCRSLKRLRI